ncbi:hypothetical protein KGY71_04485 [Candidatus Bipolaricaulota bacterium]|nr:hypothetical protein [Candidatus Bipolaricaulota bacterium]
MSEKCVYCGKRKGERECPALGGMICSRCCGEHRAVDISCPPDCRYFQKHEEFQQSKQAEPYRDTWVEENEDLLEDEQREMVEAIGILETLIYYRFREDTTLTDRRIINGLNGLENQLKTIELPGTTTEFSDFAMEELEPLMEKGKVSREKLKEATSRLLTICERFSDDSRRLVQGIVGRVKEDYNIPEEESGAPSEKLQSLISTPGEISSGR